MKFYLNNITQVNNWDLVDLSAPNILGAHLLVDDRDNQRKRLLLYRLAKSEIIWKRRIAIVATHHFIRNGDFSYTFKIAEMLLQDRHDLIHKAVGWMLREVGKRMLLQKSCFSKSTGVLCPGPCSDMLLKGCLRMRGIATRESQSIGDRYTLGKYLYSLHYLHRC